MLKVICSRSLNQLWLILLIAVSVTGNPAYAGLGFSEDEIHKFRYDVKGEIMVKPDRAVFPVLITVKSKTYKQSLERANKL
ncbi:MAG: hypothetical protein OEZ38_13960, partial [Gammaproteobacteria bacterium]|nr:hypothetical protein [Gammaproteobacteria bacterium]